MAFSGILQFFRSPVGRCLTSVLGLGAVFLVLIRTGVHAVLATLSHAAPFFPYVLLLEAGILACSMRALYLLYGKDRHLLPLGALFRAGLIGYAVMGLVPAGRAVAEATRAVMLSRYSGGARAAAAAVQMQSVVLFGNALISIPATFAVFYVLGKSLPSAFILLNFLLTAGLAAGILITAQRSEIGLWIEKRIPAVRDFGKNFDQYFSERQWLARALRWEFLGRLFQVLQNAILVVAVGGKPGAIPALCSEAVHLVGAAFGDLIPAQLGATELSYRFSSAVLAIQPSDALSIALLAHAAQLTWVGVGSLIPVLWPAQRNVAVNC